MIAQQLDHHASSISQFTNAHMKTFDHKSISDQIIIAVQLDHQYNKVK